MAAALEKLKGIEVTTLQQLRDVLKAGQMNDVQLQLQLLNDWFLMIIF